MGAPYIDSTAVLDSGQSLGVYQVTMATYIVHVHCTCTLYMYMYTVTYYYGGAQ